MMKYYLVGSDDGGWLAEVQDFEAHEFVSGKIADGYEVSEITAKTADKLSTDYIIHSVYNGQYTEKGRGKKAYIPEETAADIPKKNMAAAQLGRKGGQVKSAKKADAVRENGKKGGRPRKNP
jgi:hypothetical protein